jgi:hypothetical protein
MASCSFVDKPYINRFAVSDHQRDVYLKRKKFRQQQISVCVKPGHSRMPLMGAGIHHLQQGWPTSTHRRAT